MRLGLARGLLHVGDHALDVDGPGADERLVEEVLGIAVGPLAAPVRFVDRRPPLDGGAPALGNLGEQGQARAHVLASLAVVGRGGEHRARPADVRLDALAVELRDRHPEAAGIAPDLVERGQPVEAVERGVLHALGHDRSRELLNAQH